MAQSKRSFQDRLRDLSHGPIPDMDNISSEKFEGSPSLLKEPLPISEVSNMAGLLEFEIIDLIKLGKLRGVRNGDEWFIDGTYVGEENGIS